MSSANAPEGHAKPTAAERVGPHLLHFRACAGIRADHPRDPFLRARGSARPRRRGLARIYGERERTRIKLILRGKRLGLALSEIRELFDIYATAGNERPQLAKFLQLLAERRAMLHQQREDIDAVLAEIAFIERDCRRRLKLEARAARRQLTGRSDRRRT
jgi:DNA-binding transcriptional MerR regulator